MNEIRKQIINIIKSYMKKTKSTGCLIEVTDDGEKYYGTLIGYYQDFKKEDLDVDDIDAEIEGDVCKISEYGEKFKILGHYDITAVLKYIKENGGKEIKIDASGEIEIYNQYVGYVYLSNKPLHLYTEQEEKDLLELLKQLGPTKIN